MSSLALNRDMTRVFRIFRACQTKQINSIETDKRYFQKNDSIMTNNLAYIFFTQVAKER